MLPRMIKLIALLMGTVILSRLSLAAQSARPVANSQGPITVALVDSLPRLGKDYMAVILRRVGVIPPDVILLPRATASVELLDAATRTLLQSRATLAAERGAYGGRRFRTLTIGISRVAPAPGWWMDTYRVRLNAILAKVRTEAPRPVAGIGIVQVAQFYPPNPAPQQE